MAGQNLQAAQFPVSGDIAQLHCILPFHYQQPAGQSGRQSQYNHYFCLDPVVVCAKGHYRADRRQDLVHGLSAAGACRMVEPQETDRRTLFRKKI